MSELGQTRRRFATSNGVLLWAAALGIELENSRTKIISIFCTTDLHGHIVSTQTFGGIRDVGGFANCVSCIRQWRKDVPDSFLVDLGEI